MILLSALAWSLGACGFHRQGVTPLPEALHAVYIESRDPYTDFQRGLRKALKNAGARIVESRAEATAVLGISQDETERTVLSVSKLNKPREFEVSYTVTYMVSTSGGELLPPQTVSRASNYSFDEQTVLAKEEEENILREAMARDLAGVVMRQLSKL